jgi:DNA-binding transcriptional LysR family regulator
MDRIAAMTTFVKVVETGNLSGASRALELSLPAVCRQIDKLEAHLRSQLLVRTTRRTTLTEEGQCFYDQAKNILAAIHEAETALTTKQTTPSGQLIVSANVSFGRLRLAPLLPEFLAQFPEVTIDLLLLDRQVNLVEEGIDVTILFGDLEDSSLIARKLGEYHRIVCAAPAYLRRRGEPQRLEDLTSHDCVIYTQLDGSRTWRFRTPQGDVQVPVSGGMRTNNGEATVAAAIGGAGLIMAPTWLVQEELAAGRLVAVLKPFVSPPICVHAVFSPGRLKPAKVRAFIDYLANKARPLD